MIVGGGVAGLWILHRLLGRGVDALLIDRHGGRDPRAQTRSSQGILHRGTKYLLRGDSNSSMLDDGFPDLLERWRVCLEAAEVGRRRPGDPDLTSVRPLADGVDLVQVSSGDPSLRSRLRDAAARGLVHETSAGSFRLLEPVLDPASLLDALWRQVEARCLVGTPRIGIQASSVRVRVGRHRVAARRLVLAAGAGNAPLLSGLGRRQPTMVRRLVHLVWVDDPPGRHVLPPVQAHVLDDAAAPGSRGAHWTVTSTGSDARGWRWTVGGDPSERGVGRSDRRQHAEIRRLIARAFPALDVASLRLTSHRVDKAEPVLPGGGRRLEPFVHDDGTVLTAWPLKLVLAPLLADRVVERLTTSSSRPWRSS